MRNERILITGGSGFIGSHIVRRLIAEGHMPHVIARSRKSLWRLKDRKGKYQVHSGDLAKPNQIDAIIAKVEPTVVYHLASYGVIQGQTDPTILQQINVDATIQLLESCLRLKQVPHVIHTGSCFEYGSQTKRITERSLVKPETAYAASKAASTAYAQYYALSKQLPVTILRPFTAYGPFEDRNRLLPTLLLAAFYNTRPEISNPKPVRNFIYVEDVARAYLAVTGQSTTYGEIYNVCTQQQYSIGEMVEKVANITGQSLQPRYNKALMRAYEPTNWLASYAKLHAATGWKPNYSITRGIRSAYAWLQDHADLYV